MYLKIPRLKNTDIIVCMYTYIHFRKSKKKKRQVASSFLFFLQLLFRGFRIIANNQAFLAIRQGTCLGIVVKMLQDFLALHNIKVRQKQTQGTKGSGTSAFDKELFMKDPGEDLSFQKHLMGLLQTKDMDNATVYKRSNITKGAFSKILCGDTKIPKRSTVLALCIGLRLKIWEAEELLASCGMAFNPYSKADQLVIKCIMEGNYDIFMINILLDMCGQPQLGNVEK